MSLYPRANLGVTGGGEDEKSAAGEDTYSVTDVWFDGFVPVVVQVAPHSFVGFGPSIAHDLSRTATFARGQHVSNPSTTFGAGLLLGGSI